ncbi:hypothetical protein M0813_09936 [Anaeramoeba flamelloides]|uniref:Uncharacterized protein n=1 Tax=Anaeramoeba flamelloides TaxID=1746091 RepID=A0ABQ8X4T7_9EUKA|nr:hypothetical protein M0813_09936 [Anaeramoeba flamelloides]
MFNLNKIQRIKKIILIYLAYSLLPVLLSVFLIIFTCYPSKPAVASSIVLKYLIFDLYFLVIAFLWFPVVTKIEGLDDIDGIEESQSIENISQNTSYSSMDSEGDNLERKKNQKLKYKELNQENRQMLNKQKGEGRGEGGGKSGSGNWGREIYPKDEKEDDDSIFNECDLSPNPFESSGEENDLNGTTGYLEKQSNLEKKIKKKIKIKTSSSYHSLTDSEKKPDQNHHKINSERSEEILDFSSDDKISNYDSSFHELSENNLGNMPITRYENSNNTSDSVSSNKKNLEKYYKTDDLENKFYPKSNEELSQEF